MNADRRRVLFALAGAGAFPALALAAPLPQKRLLLFWPFDGDMSETLRDVVRALGARGWRDGRELTVSRITRTDPNQVLEDLARGAVAMRPDVMVAEGTVATDALLRATASIPVIATVGDPVGSGFAASLATPGRNFTGTAQGYREAAAKLAELAVDLLPGLRRIAVWEPPEPALRRVLANNDEAFRAKGLEVIHFSPGGGDSPGTVFPALRARGAQAAYLGPVEGEGASDVAGEGIRHRLPLFSKGDGGVAAGLLASVDNDPAETVELLASQVDRVLRGAAPARLPILFPQRFRTAVNRKTAEALGLRIPPHVLLRADRVVE